MSAPGSSPAPSPPTATPGGGDRPPAIKLVDVATSRVRSLDVPGDVSALGFSPDGSVVAAGDFDGRVFRIDVSATALIGEAAVSHDGPVLGIAPGATAGVHVRQHGRHRRAVGR